MKDTHFFEGLSPFALLEQYGSPLYVYNERVFRERCREMARLVTYPHFKVNYSVKANSNLTLLRIAREEGLHVDAMSPGEIYLEELAGFTPDEIFYISNNVSTEEMAYAVSRGIMVSIDSLSQLERFGHHFPGHPVCIRVNSGVGAGHSDKVITGGEKTKFAICPADFPRVREILQTYELRLVGLNQHIGSFFLEEEPYLEGVRALLALAMDFPGLEFIDLGGGFGMPYERTQSRLDLASLGAKLSALMEDFAARYGSPVLFKIEPGRYLAAECCVLLGTVQAVKENYGHVYCGTDIGFNVLARPMLYGSYHEIEILSRDGSDHTDSLRPYTVVGNICESGDILAHDRMLPAMREEDLVCIHDAGAYGYSMASNYNNRLRPAEVLIDQAGTSRLIRRRDTLEDLTRGFEV